MSSSIGMKVALGAAMLTGGITLLYIYLTGRKRQPDPGKASDPLDDKSKDFVQKEGCEMNGHACTVKDSENVSSELKREDSDKDSLSSQNCVEIEKGKQNSGNNSVSVITGSDVIHCLSKKEAAAKEEEKGKDCEFEEPVVANNIESVEKTPTKLLSLQDVVNESIQEDQIYTVAVLKNECIVENSSDEFKNNVEDVSENELVDKCVEALSLVNNELKQEINENSIDNNVDQIPVESITEGVEVEKCVEALSLVEEEIVCSSVIENDQDSLAVDVNIVNNNTEAEIATESFAAAQDKIMTKLADVEEIISDATDDAKVLAEPTQSDEVTVENIVKESVAECVNVCDNSVPLSTIPVEVKDDVINEEMSSSWASVVEEGLQEEDENLKSVSCDGSEESLGNEIIDSSRKLAQSPMSNSSHSSSPRRRKQKFKKTRTDSATADLELEINSEQDQPNSDSVSLVSMDSGQGASEIEPETLFNPSSFPVSKQEQYIFYEFEIPQTLVGRLIGRKGAFVNKIKACTEATIVVCAHKNRRLKICSVEGTRQQVDAALKMIREQFPVNRYPDITLDQLASKSQNFNNQNNTMQQQPILNSPAMQVTLTAGVVVEVQVSTVVSGGEMWLQQPLHPSFSSLHRLNTCMNLNYADGSTTPQIPQPIQSGTVCVCQVEGQWLRCQVFGSSEHDGESYVLLLDIGSVISVTDTLLRQIRFDYLTLPFQASQCLLSGIEPLDGESWSSIAATVLEELVSNTLLFATVVSYTQEGVPLVNLYRRDNDQYVSLNEKMVKLGHARWLVPAAETS